MLPRILLTLLLCVSCSAGREEVVIRHSATATQIDNGSIRREIVYSSTTGGPISHRTTSLTPPGSLSLTSETGPPWFEFSVNHRLLTNVSPLWQHTGWSVDTLAKGSREVRLRFRTPEGLELTLVAQVFPGVPLLRERAELRTAGGTFALTEHGGRVHLVFPSYSLPVAAADSVRAEEIQLAVWTGGSAKLPDGRVSYDERAEESGWRIGRNLGQNYMYHPVRTTSELHPGEKTRHRGEVFIVQKDPGGSGWMIVHEHDSPAKDNERAAVMIEDLRSSNALTVSAITVDGAYVDGQPLQTNREFATTWVTNGWYAGKSFDDGEAFFWSYLHRWFCRNPNTRIPKFYYNTWGMQRDESAKGKDVRKVLNQSRVLDEVKLAADLGVEVFILDDGWQDRFGDWLPDHERFPGSLKPLADELGNRHIVFGIWLGCLAVDSSAIVHQKHPGWLVRDSLQNPIVGRWGRQVFCLVSDYEAYFLDVCKRLIDSGVRYFKWDGLDYHPCSSAEHHHGNGSTPELTRVARYRFEMGETVVRMAEELRRYNKDVVIEVDATEAGRPIGVGFLREGKYFWINNGASWYGDRSQYRAKSMRTVTSAYASLLPTGFQTYANYPHNHPTFGAQRYNVNSSLIGGRGFWGDLSEMTPAERQAVGRTVQISKKITPAVAGIRPTITGRVGAEMEFYCAVDFQRAEGQVITFAGAEGKTTYSLVGVETDSLLAVINNAYSVADSTVTIPFEYPQPDVSREAFLFSNHGTGISIVSSTSWLKDARILAEGEMQFVSGAPGRHIVHWRHDNGVPTLRASGQVEHSITEPAHGGEYRIEIVTPLPDVLVEIRNKK